MVVQQLQKFAITGGKVIFTGDKPSYLYGRSLMDSIPAGGFNWSKEITPEAFAMAPDDVTGGRDVILDQQEPAIKYNHRHLRDGELYFFFNEAEEEQHCQVTLEEKGVVIQLNMMDGTIEKVEAVSISQKAITISLDLNAWETAVFILNNTN